MNVALVVLAGFVAGAIIAVSRFDDPRWLYSGWFRLTTLAITTGLLIWVAAKLPGRRFRRAMQLAAVLSLLVHFIVVVVLYNQRPTYLQAQQFTEADVTVFEQPVELPDYSEPQDEQALQEHEKPVEAEIPEQTQTSVPAERQETPQERPTEGQPTPEPGMTPEVESRAMEKAAVVEAAARRSDEQSRISRQTAKATPRPNEPIAVPQEQPAQESAAQVTPGAQTIKRMATAAPDMAGPGEEPATVPVQRQVTQIARRDSSETLLVDSPSVPTLNRALNEPRFVPLVEANARQPVAVSPTAESNRLLPNSVVIDRQTTAPNIAQQIAAEPRPSAAPTSSPIDSARQQLSDAPQLASAPPAVERPTAAAKLPGVATADAPQAEATTEIVGGLPAPTVTQVARGEAEAPGVSPIHAAGGDPGAAAATIAGGSIARAVQADVPSISPQDAPTGVPARATVVAQTSGSPMNIESPSVAIAEEVSADAAPTRSVLSRGTAGIAGIGRDVNFDRGGESATPHPAPTPSASARRTEASQTAPPGSALSPSMPALVAKSIADANIPQGTLAAQDVDTGTVGGVANPGNMEASSGAAVVRADASARAGKITAGVGQGDFDIGPPQIVAKVGTGRPGGGGGPEIRLDKQGPQFSRQASGGAPLAAIAAATVAEMPQAPAGAGGGGPAGNGGSVGGPAVGGGGAIGATKSAPGGTIAAAGQVGDPVVGGGRAAIASGPMVRAGGSQRGIPGPAAIGGVRQPGRAVGRVAFAEVVADAPQMSAGPVVGSPSLGAGIEAVGDTSVKGAAGLPGRTTAGPVGAIAGDVPVQSTVVGGRPGLGLARRKGPTINEAAPTVGAVGAPGIQRKSNIAGLPAGQIAGIEAPALPSGGGTGVGPGVAGSLELTQPGTGIVASRSAGAMPVQVAALDGPGGLGLSATPNVGSISRQARRNSEVVHAGAARFLSRRVAGPLSIDGGAREPAMAYSRRRGRKIDPLGEYGQPLERTEESVELGLDFLARHQSPDGSWSLHNYGAGRKGYEKETSRVRSDTAATGLALLAFLGAGYDHYDDNYAGQIRQALEFLVKNQKTDGDLFLPMDAESNKSVWLYSHGIATIALCEAFGMTGDADLREPAQKAINFIVKSQSIDRGGWRYVPGRESDTSVSGWQLMALKSGELAGLKVPKETYDRVAKWLDSSQTSPNGQTQYAYNPFAPLQTAPGRFADHGRRPTPATTSMGLLMRLYTGWNRSDARLKTGCDFLLQNPPLMGNAGQPTRDSYYWYYATQLMFHMKGDYWKQWNERLHPALVHQQVQSGPFAGSWDPRLPVPDRWGVLGGRMYVTTLNLLSLEVYYRHLPIYEQTAK